MKKFSKEYFERVMTSLDTHTIIDIDIICDFVCGNSEVSIERDDIYVMLHNVDSDFIHCLASAISVNEESLDICSVFRDVLSKKVVKE